MTRAAVQIKSLDHAVRLFSAERAVEKYFHGGNDLFGLNGNRLEYVPHPKRCIQTRGNDMIGRLLDWFGEDRLGVFAASLLCVAGLACFIAVANEVFQGDTQSFDDWAIKAMRNPDDLADLIGPEWLGEAGRDMTALGGVLVLTMMSLAIAGYMWLSGKRREFWLLVAATLGGVAISSMFKVTFDRPRPELVPKLSYVTSSSFPSGHAMMSAVVYLTLVTVLAEVITNKRLKCYCLAVAMTIVLLVGVSRVYMGVHYPTDVLAGWSAGLVWAMLCWLAVKLLQRRTLMGHAASRAEIARKLAREPRTPRAGVQHGVLGQMVATETCYPTAAGVDLRAVTCGV